MVFDRCNSLLSISVKFIDSFLSVSIGDWLFFVDLMESFFTDQ